MRALLTLAAATRAAGATNAFGAKFLADNKAKPGVVALPSGLQYKVIRAGEGYFHPTADQTCVCHYEGRTAQEFVKAPEGNNHFDSSYKRGKTIPIAPNQACAAA